MTHLYWHYKRKPPELLRVARLWLEERDDLFYHAQRLALPAKAGLPSKWDFPSSTF